MFDNDFGDMFAVEYEYFLIDDEPKYDVVEFDDLRSTIDCLLTNAYVSILPCFSWIESCSWFS